MPGTSLTVTLSGGSAADARTVVHALEPAFGPAQELPADERATVFTATFGGTAPSAPPARDGAAGRLSAPVTVTVQGSPEAVRTASRTLARAFGVTDEGTAAGDQEQERQLVLRS
ncbi:hypothetical protein ACFOOM_17355 [Streptomyces echinoruber]|jgi:hypothetical protein|uniref:Uncharacterized protein n=1 Tax=Streptomyces echinoruber TaxID=68898 RepID=A0A918RG44_9ACTN|nr:hypothetical protein [Streptomyces echinoruber]GGZ96624.1 hypothetical protein GCM10010389_39880 [Streptomyces echinoruber]